MRVPRKVLLVFAITLALLICAGVVYIYRTQLQQLLSLPTQNTARTAAISDTNNPSYTFQFQSFPDERSFEDQIKLLREENPQITITISNDETVAINKYKENGNIVSGYSFGGTLAAPNFSEVIIYISPEKTDLQQRQFELARAYIGALLTAEEFRKEQRDTSYKANYELVQAEVHRLMMQIKDQNQYPILIRET